MKNFIHETSIIGDNVKIGKNNHIGPFCVITGNTTIGDNNRFECNCVIGTNAEHSKFIYDNSGFLNIGDNNIFREFCSVNIGTTSKTIIKNNVKMLRNSHVGHDCTIEDDVTITSNVVVAGNCYVMLGANLGLGSLIHQESIIGHYAMIGMGCVVWKKSKIEPCKIYFGNPSKCIGMNEIGIERNKITEEKLNYFKSEYNIKINEKIQN
jgi:UDP-N-acetylglucosamine acyltransferase